MGYHGTVLKCKGVSRNALRLPCVLVCAAIDSPQVRSSRRQSAFLSGAGKATTTGVVPFRDLLVAKMFHAGPSKSYTVILVVFSEIPMAVSEVHDPI